MSSAPLRHVVRQLLRGLPPADGTDDVALLDRFIAWRDEAAFESLVCRHGPLVRGVCRRVLPHKQDAEDAFQTTFLARAPKAEAVPCPRVSRARNATGPIPIRTASTA